ncbi:hypothetical protein DFH06DRAFT_1337412 [Mycena polygramma]|nr:hypothetical protein DFH06DRAFT_1337412 [Mycena polygramma]
MPRAAAPLARRLPDDVDQFIASQQPTWSLEQRQQAFDMVVNFNNGGFDEAVKYYKQSMELYNSGAMIGGQTPPPNVLVKEATVGPYTIFYHSGPKHLEGAAAFLWSAYIGLRGKGQESIIPTTEWKREGIHVEVLHNDEWQACGMLLVTPLTRVRFT